jgi:hypothetical protein
MIFVKHTSPFPRSKILNRASRDSSDTKSAAAAGPNDIARFLAGMAVPKNSPLAHLRAIRRASAFRVF